MFEELGYTPNNCSFKLWSPDAEAVLLRLYNDYGLIREDLMLKQQDGFWTFDVFGDYKGNFYTFDVKYRGRFLGETPGLSPKAVNVNGTKGAIIDFEDTNPKDWENDIKPELKDFSEIIIYETHHRDFSMHRSSGVENKGKFLQWTENMCNVGADCMSTQIQNDNAIICTGVAHLKEMGITHLHLLPSFDFATVDEATPNVPQYNWGYDPLNYNVPEGSYSTDAMNPISRILEFKKMVQALHKNGIRVVMDVVYNHSYFTENSYFEKIAPRYFYRFRPDGSYADASWCGNEMASEKPMVRQFIIESLCYWAKEYHIDGFRVDLMGILDIETVNLARKVLDKIDKSIFIYGEGWYGEKPQLDESLIAVKCNIPKMPRIAAFSDEFRDGIRGVKGWNGKLYGGFVLGNGFTEHIKLGLTGGVFHPQINYNAIHNGFQTWANQPNQFLAYASCHDDFCITDTLKQTAPPDSSLQDIVQYSKLAHSIVLLSQGVPFLFAGEEFLREKKMIRNTYKSSDNINAIDWNNKILYKEMCTYFKNFIALRKKIKDFMLGDAESIRQLIVFEDVPENLKNQVIHYKIFEKTKKQALHIVINASKESITMNFRNQNVKILLNNENFDGFENHKIIVNAVSCTVFLA